NTHLAAYSHDGTKKKQLDILNNLLESYDSRQTPFIVGGDFNSVPPESQKVKDFPDAACEDEDLSADDYSEEIDWLKPFYRFSSAIPLDSFKINNKANFTHTTKSPANGGFWTRKIDYIFTNGEFVPGSGLTHQDKNSGGMNTMKLSDHAPITVEYIR
ncbi:MAG: endonuclease/exonuclease/phosphatase family protein, partial [Bacteroidota bacterium]|nr:endonuclease/exonuclease/phosphatase family protein [Bacteroidota bacterium]